MKGFSAVRQASTDIADRKNSGSSFGPKELWPALRDNNSSVIVRFLEQGEDVACAWMHEYKKPNVSRSFFVPCLDQKEDGTPCPACERAVKRTFKGYLNVIWRDSPQLKRDPETNRAVKQGEQYIVEGTKDEVAVWVQGITVFEDLADKDVTYKGICSRDFKITRKGLKLQTKYTIEPADVDAGPSPLSSADEALAAEKYDLREHYLTPASYEEMDEIFGGTGASGGGVSQAHVDQAKAASPWNRPDGDGGGSESRANRFLA